MYLIKYSMLIIETLENTEKDKEKTSSVVYFEITLDLLVYFLPPFYSVIFLALFLKKVLIV